MNQKNKIPPLNDDDWIDVVANSMALEGFKTDIEQLRKDMAARETFDENPESPGQEPKR